MVVGGYAVSYYGYSRVTADIDVWVAMDPANIRALAQVLVDFGFKVGEPFEKVLEPGRMLRFGVPPLRIEILSRIDGVEFEACYSTRKELRVDDTVVPVIGLEDLKTNKAAAGRPKDLIDLENIVG